MSDDINEVIGNKPEDYIHDFVHSKNKKFKNDTKKKRIKRALAAYYNSGKDITEMMAKTLLSIGATNNDERRNKGDLKSRYIGQRQRIHAKVGARQKNKIGNHLAEMIREKLEAKDEPVPGDDVEEPKKKNDEKESTANTANSKADKVEVNPVHPELTRNV